MVHAQGVYRINMVKSGAVPPAHSPWHAFRDMCCAAHNGVLPHPLPLSLLLTLRLLCSRAQLCSGGADSKVIVWDITTPSLPVKVTEWLAHFGTVYALSALAENETGLVSGGTDTLVKVGASCCFRACQGIVGQSVRMGLGLHALDVPGPFLFLQHDPLVQFLSKPQSTAFW
jgi:hypothetical protein